MNKRRKQAKLRWVQDETKVDTNSNNKTRTQTDLAKSFRRRASDNEEITFGGTGETLADRKGTKGSQISSPKVAGGD